MPFIRQAACPPYLRCALDELVAVMEAAPSDCELVTDDPAYRERLAKALVAAADAVTAAGLKDDFTDPYAWRDSSYPEKWAMYLISLGFRGNPDGLEGDDLVKRLELVERLERKDTPAFYSQMTQSMKTFRDVVCGQLQHHMAASTPEGQQQTETAPLPKRAKRSHSGDEARQKIISTLTAHHRYTDGICESNEPIGSNELARQAEVSSGSTSNFFKEVFGGHRLYKTMCLRNRGKLNIALRNLNGETPTKELLYGRRPFDEDTRNGDE
jgi:hypothetical protein